MYRLLLFRDVRSQNRANDDIGVIAGRVISSLLLSSLLLFHITHPFTRCARFADANRADLLLIFYSSSLSLFLLRSTVRLSQTVLIFILILFSIIHHHMRRRRSCDRLTGAINIP